MCTHSPLTHIVFLLHFSYNLGVGRPPEDALSGESWKPRGPGESQGSGGWSSSLPYQSWSSKKGHWEFTSLCPEFLKGSWVKRLHGTHREPASRRRSP